MNLQPLIAKSCGLTLEEPNAGIASRPPPGDEGEEKVITTVTIRIISSVARNRRDRAENPTDACRSVNQVKGCGGMPVMA
jgi:hypothetical protein